MFCEFFAILHIDACHSCDEITDRRLSKQMRTETVVLLPDIGRHGTEITEAVHRQKGRLVIIRLDKRVAAIIPMEDKTRVFVPI